MIINGHDVRCLGEINLNDVAVVGVFNPDRYPLLYCANCGKIALCREVEDTYRSEECDGGLGWKNLLEEC